jgi:XTP/dITP diphosphohydrolase
VTQPLILATRNDHKLREIRRMLGDTLAIEPLPDGIEMPPETGETYAENALIKARAAAAATGRTAFADDSGIEAEALAWRPGVRSARYAGEDATDAENLDKLRAEAPPGTRLRYVCVIAVVDPDGTERCFEGKCAGAMAPEARGERGFGYDPVFLPDAIGDGRTMAELDDSEKDAVSHRGAAVRAMAAGLAAVVSVAPVAPVALRPRARG